MAVAELGSAKPSQPGILHISRHWASAIGDKTGGENTPTSFFEAARRRIRGRRFAADRPAGHSLQHLRLASAMKLGRLRCLPSMYLLGTARKRHHNFTSHHPP